MVENTVRGVDSIKIESGIRVYPREASTNDAERITPLYQSTYKAYSHPTTTEAIEKQMTQIENKWYVVENEKRDIIGCTCLTFKKHLCYAGRLIVKDVAGASSAFIQYRIEQAKKYSDFLLVEAVTSHPYSLFANMGLNFNEQLVQLRSFFNEYENMCEDENILETIRSEVIDFLSSKQWGFPVALNPNKYEYSLLDGTGGQSKESTIQLLFDLKGKIRDSFAEVFVPEECRDLVTYVTKQFGAKRVIHSLESIGEDAAFDADWITEGVLNVPFDTVLDVEKFLGYLRMREDDYLEICVNAEHPSTVSVVKDLQRIGYSVTGFLPCVGDDGISFDKLVLTNKSRDELQKELRRLGENELPEGVRDFLSVLDLLEL